MTHTSVFAFLDKHAELVPDEVVFLPQDLSCDSDFIQQMRSKDSQLQLCEFVKTNTCPRPDWPGENNLRMSETHFGQVVKEVSPMDDHGYVYTSLLITEKQPNNTFLLQSRVTALSRQKVWLVSDRKIRFDELTPEEKLEMLGYVPNLDLHQQSQSEVMQALASDEFREACKDASWNWAQAKINSTGDADLIRENHAAVKLLNEGLAACEGGDELDHCLDNIYFWRHEKYGLMPCYADLAHGRKHIAEQLPIFGFVKQRPTSPSGWDTLQHGVDTRGYSGF